MKEKREGVERPHKRISQIHLMCAYKGIVFPSMNGGYSISIPKVAETAHIATN